MCATRLVSALQAFPSFYLGPDGFPLPGQVIRHYRQKKLKENGKAWTQRDLALKLGKQELAIREMELRDTGLQDIARRRFLAELLAIPPELLGLATAPEDCNAPSTASPWWVRQGFPAFEIGSDGFPRPGQVVRHFRVLKVKANGKRWTQYDLAQVLDKQELAIREMELHDSGLQDITRRQFLIELLNIPPILLGIAEAPQERIDYPIVPLLNQGNGADLAFYEEQLHTYYNAHHRHASYEHLFDIQGAIAFLYQALPFSERQNTRQLLGRYHILMASVLRDQHCFREASEHLTKAILLTEQIGDTEFLADAHYRQGWVYLEQKEGKKASQHFSSAERLLKKIPSYMGSGILIGLGRSLAIQTSSSQESLTALHLLDKAANILRIHPLPEGNPHYLEIELDRYHTDKSAAFLDVGFPHEALQELSYVRPSTRNQRRNALISGLQAQAYFAIGHYPEACSMAEETLDFVQPIHSIVNYERIKLLHSQLKLTSFGNDPEVARLGAMIRRVSVSWERDSKARKT